MKNTIKMDTVREIESIDFEFDVETTDSETDAILCSMFRSNDTYTYYTGEAWMI